MKKQMLMIVLAIMSSNAFSVTGLDRWKDIRSSTDLMIRQPAFAKIFGEQGLFNACATEEELRSKTPVKSNELGTRNISISRVHTENVCVNHDNRSGECLEYGDVTSVYPTSFQLAVLEVQENGNGDFIFSKTYALSPCD
jgi:hypothetical protein